MTNDTKEELMSITGETVATSDDYVITRTPPIGSGSVVYFRVYEWDPATGEPLRTWRGGDHRYSIDVEAWPPTDRGAWEALPAQVSWPSTSDKRPALARALAEALRLAADEAERMDAEYFDREEA